MMKYEKSEGMIVPIEKKQEKPDNLG